MDFLSAIYIYLLALAIKAVITACLSTFIALLCAITSLRADMCYKFMSSRFKTSDDMKISESSDLCNSPVNPLPIYMPFRGLRNKVMTFVTPKLLALFFCQNVQSYLHFGTKSYT